MSQKLLGIDLGTHTVKILLIERRVQDIQVLEYIEEELNLQSRLSHAEQCAVVLEKVFSNHLLDADIVSTSFPGHLLSTRVVELPFTNTKKIGHLVDFELESFIPFPIENIFSDFHVMSVEENSSKILTVYSQDDNFASYMEHLSNAKIESKYMGADFTDLAGIAQLAMLPTDGYYGILDIGHSKANLLIMEGKELRYVRPIGMGGYHFTRAIQRAFNLNYEKAEAMKLSRGKILVKDEATDQVSLILGKTASELATLIKQTVMAAARELPDFHLTALYCCGGGAKLLGILEYLSYALKVNVFQLDCLNYVNHHFEDPEEVAVTIPQVLATTVRPIYANKIPRINFRKGPYAYKADLEVLTNELKSVGVFVVIMAILAGVYYFYADSYYTDKMAAIDKKIESVVKKDFRDIMPKGKRGKKISLTKYVTAAKKKLKDLKQTSPSMEADPNSVLGLMEVISNSLPPKKDVIFQVNEFHFTEDTIRMNASIKDTLNVEKIVKALKESNRFRTVESTDAKPKPNDLYDFMIKLAIKKGGDDEGEEE